MASEKTSGIVLRVTDFSETSCIVTMMTREFGKITLIAKGARRPKSPFEAALDVLAICRIVFLHKTSGAMSLLTEAKLERRFRSSATSLNRLYFGYYIVELLNTLTDEGDPNPALFELAVSTINEVDSKEHPDSELSRLLLRFELALLQRIGHTPMLTKCVSCGKEKTTLTRVSFGLNSGGILCQGCRRTDTNVVNISPEGFQFFLNLVGGQIGAQQDNSDNWDHWSRVRETNTGTQSRSKSESIFSETTETIDVIEPPQPLKEIRSLVSKYMTHLIGSPPKLHPFLNHL